MEPSPHQNEVTPSTMSQPHHLQPALWGPVPGSMSLLIPAILGAMLLPESLGGTLLKLSETKKQPWLWLLAQDIARKTLVLPVFGRGWPSLLRPAEWLLAIPPNSSISSHPRSHW